MLDPSILVDHIPLQWFISDHSDGLLKSKSDFSLGIRPSKLSNSLSEI